MYLHEHAAPFRLDAGGPDAILMLHGWTGTPAHFRMLGHALHADGFTVYAPLYPGHGTRIDHMVETTRKDWVGAAVEALFELHETHRRVHLFGLSMGALIALLLAATTEAATITLLNTPIRVRSRALRVAGIVGRVRAISRGGSWDPPDDEAADFYHQYDDTPLASVRDLHQLMRAGRQALPRVHEPCLILQSHRDPVVDPESATLVYEEIGSLRKRLVWLDGDRHVATLDVIRHEIEAALLAHIRSATG